MSQLTLSNIFVSFPCLFLKQHKRSVALGWGHIAEPCIAVIILYCRSYCLFPFSLCLSLDNVGYNSPIRVWLNEVNNLQQPLPPSSVFSLVSEASTCRACSTLRCFFLAFLRLCEPNVLLSGYTNERTFHINFDIKMQQLWMTVPRSHSIRAHVMSVHLRCST